MEIEIVCHLVLWTASLNANIHIVIYHHKFLNTASADNSIKFFLNNLKESIGSYLFFFFFLGFVILSLTACILFYTPTPIFWPVPLFGPGGF